MTYVGGGWRREAPWGDGDRAVEDLRGGYVDTVLAMRASPAHLSCIGGRALVQI
jgi:hypothetical protein